jgi:oligoribonuclease NrnB/cAMP/cGMP phosphodiesterase (DHH superfamily)
MNTCIFHANCPDGIMSAVVASLANPGIQLVPASDRRNPPPPELIDGKDVLIADFSYPLQIMEDMASRASSLVLLDHHATAEKALKHLPYCVFDQNKSGAQVCWDFFFPGQQQPLLLQAVGEADRGLSQLPFTRKIMTLAEVLPFDAEAWLDFAIRLENNLEAEIAGAEAIAAWRSAKIDRLLRKAFFTEIGGHIVPAINSCDFKSELGRRLALGNPFAAVFSGCDGKWYISLRSSDSGLDVAQIAEAAGGGGHRNAAAFISDRAPRNIEDML